MRSGSAVIVGAGINGLTTALALATDGWKVTLCDTALAGDRGSASTGTHRLIHPWSSRGSRAIARDAEDALDAWQRLLDRLGSDGFERTGVIALDSARGTTRRLPSKESQRLSPVAVSRLLPTFTKAERRVSATLYPRHGVLFARRIVSDLVAYLRKMGVELIEDAAVSSIDVSASRARLQDGREFQADRIVLAAGAGTGKILDNSSDLRELRARFGFVAKRCYVLYGQHPDFSSSKHVPAWASLGVGDTWGMPPMRGVPLKLGLGGLTRTASIDERGDRVRAADIISYYARHFPSMADVKPLRLSFGHWTAISAPSRFVKIGRCFIITSDSGSGFKFASIVGNRIARAARA